MIFSLSASTLWGKSSPNGGLLSNGARHHSFSTCTVVPKKPQLPYMRLPKLQEIKRNEIVVFSWPADTVRQFFKKEARVDKPIDKKSNYVKRCVAIPGDTLEIIDGIIHINGERTQLPDRAKPLYGYTAYSKTGISSRELIQAGIRDLTRRFRIESNISQQQLNALFANNINVIRQGDNLIAISGARGIPTDLIRRQRLRVTELRDTQKTIFLTLEEAEKVRNEISFDSLVRNINNRLSYNTNFFPNDIRYNWNEDNFGPIVMPKKGVTISLSKNNIALYRKLIRDYENRTLTYENNTISIDGEATDQYTFSQDYYWMMGDNRHRSEDSRFWGFVPADHIVGKPIFIWMSIDGFNDGIANWKVRWNRVFTTTNGDGEPVSYRWHFLAIIVAYQVFIRFRKRLKNNDPYPTPPCLCWAIAHWVPICKQQPILWEVEDFYQKQTYRNRMEIHAANGKLMLSIPIQHLGYDGRQNYKDVQIANEFPWQRNHWLSLKTAYQSSPFFEYYEDDIAPLYQTPYKSLFAFNKQVMETICELLQIQAPQETTSTYEKDSPTPRFTASDRCENRKGNSSL